MMLSLLDHSLVWLSWKKLTGTTYLQHTHVLHHKMISHSYKNIWHPYNFVENKWVGVRWVNMIHSFSITWGPWMRSLYYFIIIKHAHISMKSTFPCLERISCYCYCYFFVCHGLVYFSLLLRSSHSKRSRRCHILFFPLQNILFSTIHLEPYKATSGLSQAWLR